MAIGDLLAGASADTGNAAMEAEAAELEREAAQPAAPTEPPPAPAEGDHPSADPPSGEGAPQAPAADQDDDDGGDPQRQVPYGALRAERARRRQLEQQHHQLQGQVNAFNQAFSQWQQRGGQPGGPQPQEPQQQQVPSVEDDPVGALRYTQQQLADLQASMRQQAETQQLQQAYVAGAQAFSKTTADFGEAYQYAIQSRANELRALGAPDQAIAQQLRAEEQQVVAMAVRAGRNPAEIIYAAAKARGWQPKAAPATPQQATVAPAIPAVPPATKAAAATALPSGGAPRAGEITAQAAAAGSGKDIDRWFDQAKKSNGRSFMGR